jgi:hypothetical protein
MEGVLKDALSSQPILQVFAGAIALMVVAYMVMRGTKDRESTPASPTLPAPAPGGITDVPAMFAQGPQEMMNTFREIRDNLRKSAENSQRLIDYVDKLSDDVRAIKDDGHQRTDILRSIDKEQSIANRAAHPARNP